MKRKVGNKDRDVRQTQNSKYSESLETPPIKRKVGHPKKVSGLMKINRHLLKDEGVQGKAMMKRKSKQSVLKDFVEMILAKFKNIHHDLRSLSEELYEGLSRFPDCVKLNELNKKFQEDFRNKDLARNEDDEDANVANPSEAANVAVASPTAQGSRATILHASPIRMTKKAAKRTA
nr:hypothetical protein [Tanacetum cinerariifolium]